MRGVSAGHSGRVRAGLGHPHLPVTKFHGLRSLRLMGVFRAGIHLQFVEHDPAQTGLRQHASDGFLDDQFRTPIPAVLGSFSLQSLVARVPAIELLLPLLTGELHLFSVDHHDVVARVDVGRVGRAMLAHQHHGNIAGQATDYLVAGVNQPPTLLYLTDLGHERLHRMVPSLSGIQ